jgi:ribosome maturation factor RimP
VGELEGVEDEAVIVAAPEGRCSVALKDIAKANLIYEF